MMLTLGSCELAQFSALARLVKANGTCAPTRAVHAHPPAPTPALVAVARVRSALDVLADQAAQEQERMPVNGARSSRLQESAEHAHGARVGPSAQCNGH